MSDHSPDSTPPDLEQRLERWAEDAQRVDPHVAPHLDELTDHLRTAVQSQIDEGQELDGAFNDAALAFGEPSAVAAEYRKGRGFLRCWFSDMGTRPNPDRAEAIVAAGWIVLSLAWVGATFGLGFSVNWMIAGWTATTFGPLTVLDAILRRRRTA
ncbi:MAG: hypothetical protein O3A10_00510 [Chloroflexi bacterium]|nr:hypothetical protein [Chloroflexota bacterium]MDA1145438.1 hypothetical protein [Chloroflexota bacterium]